MSTTIIIIRRDTADAAPFTIRNAGFLMTAWNEFVCVPQAIISSRERVGLELHKQRLMGWNRFY